MMGSTKAQIQVFVSIILPISVDMMHNLSLYEFPTNPFFHDDNMLNSPASSTFGYLNSDITVLPVHIASPDGTFSAVLPASITP
jgi:hypothetical protein